MGITICYSILFEVKVLHHYLLNKRMTNFASMNTDEQAEMMLLLRYPQNLPYLTVNPDEKRSWTSPLPGQTNRHRPYCRPEGGSGSRATEDVLRRFNPLITT